MWRNRGNSKKEGTFARNSLFKQTVGSVGDDICGVLIFMMHRRVLVVLVDGVEVRVGARIEQEVGGGPAGDVRRVVVVNSVSVEQFARVVGRVAGFLQPDGQVVFIEALRDKFRVATY